MIARYVVVLSLILFANAFTREYRTFNYVVDRTDHGQELVLKFDPFLQSFEETLKEFCTSYLLCRFENVDEIGPVAKVIYEEYENEVLGNIEEVYQRSTLSKSSEGFIAINWRYEWLDQADDLTVKAVLETKSDSERLWEILRQMTAARSVDMISDLKVLSSKWNVPLRMQVDSTPSELLEVAFTLFNRNYYDQSFVIASHLFLHQPELQGQDFISLVDSSTFYEFAVEDKLLLYTLLSELFQLRNELQGCVALHAKTLILLSSQIIYSSDDDGQAVGQPIKGIDSFGAYLARIRTVLFMPILPSEFTSAVYHRSKMIADIEAITESIIAHNVTLPIQVFVDRISATFFRLPHQGLNDKSINCAIIQMYEALCPDFTFTSSRLQKSLKDKLSAFAELSGGMKAVLKPKKQNFRIAFVSSHFYHHSIGRILIELMYHMRADAASLGYGHFELFAFFMDNHAMSNEDELTKAYQTLLKENFVVIPYADIGEMRNIIGSKKYDLDALVFADVGMDMQSVVLSNSRLAPIQVAWWGHPVTTGSSAIDYFFGLDVEAPNAGVDHYTEQLVRHEWMNTAPIKPLEESARESLLKSSSLQIGIPEGSKHFLILGRIFKIHPAFDEVLFEILLRTSPDVYIVVIREKDNLDLNSELYQRLKRKQAELCCSSNEVPSLTNNSCCGKTQVHKDFYEHQYKSFSASGMNDYERLTNSIDSRYVLHRIRFIHYNNYLKALMTATAVLDTFPYGGCLTTHDALSSAVPILTLPLEHVRGRYSVGMYRQMGLSDLIARNASVFIDLAVRLAIDLDFRRLQSTLIAKKYDSMHRNRYVALEWLQFLDKAIKQLL